MIVINVHLDWLSVTTGMLPRLIGNRLRAVGVCAVHAVMPHTRGYTQCCEIINGTGDAICTIESGVLHGRNLVVAFGFQPNARIWQVFVPIDDCVVMCVDSAIDVEGDWDYYADFVQHIAEIFRKGCPAIRSINRIKSDTGRTLYFGSSKSAIVVRVYEKTREQWAKGNTDYSAGIIRIELQWRPMGDNRRCAMIMSFSEMWGVLPWTTDIARSLLDGVQVIDRPVHEATTWDRRYYWLTTQATRIFEEAVACYGLLSVLADMGIDDVTDVLGDYDVSY